MLLSAVLAQVLTCLPVELLRFSCVAAAYLKLQVLCAQKWQHSS